MPAVTKYIEKSRKNSYKATVSAYAGGLMNEISSGNLPSMTDEDTIYYIPFKCINLEKGGTTMYGTGDWDFAYVLMTITNGQRNYSIYSKDSKGMGIVGIDVDKIKQSDIYSIWYKSTDYIPVDGKTKIKLVDDACNFAGMTDQSPGVTPPEHCFSVDSYGNIIWPVAGTYNSTTKVFTPSTTGKNCYTQYLMIPSKIGAKTDTKIPWGAFQKKV